jgi:hypothetical protein
MTINYRFNLKVIQSLAFTVITLLIVLQTAAWGTIGMAEWEISTPGGNKIGNSDGLHGNVRTAIYKDYSTIYVKNVQEYGFYTKAVIGKAEQGFFVFNEKTKETKFFRTKAQLCSKVKEQGLKLDFIYSFCQWIYYLIRYSFYFLMPFLILLSIHRQKQPKITFITHIDKLLQSKVFAMQLYGASSIFNFILLSLNRTNPKADFMNLIFIIPIEFVLLGFTFLILWLFTQLVLMLLGKVEEFCGNYNNSNRYFTSLLKVIIFLGVFMAGLSFTISAWEAPLASVQYFSCNFL